MARIARKVVAAVRGASREEAMHRIEERLAAQLGPADAVAAELRAAGGEAGRG